MGADGRAKWRRWLSGRRLGRNQGALKQTPMEHPLNSASASRQPPAASRSGDLVGAPEFAEHPVKHGFGNREPAPVARDGSCDDSMAPQFLELSTRR